jgi:hypothetical protein
MGVHLFQIGFIGKSVEFLSWFTLDPPCRCVPKEKVVCCEQRLLQATTFVQLFEGNGWRLILHLYNLLIVLSLVQERKLYFSTFRFEDSLHLLQWLPDRHITMASSWSTVWV